MILFCIFLVIDVAVFKSTEHAYYLTTWIIVLTGIQS
jgi:hypothetical protein